MGRIKNYHIVLFAFLLALSILLHYLEGFIPTIVPVPGFRLGLANIPIVFALYYFGYLAYLILMLLKLLFVGLLFSGFGPSFYLALGGTILSIIITLMTYKFLKTSIYATSIAASIFHALGQLIAYHLFFQTPTIYFYLTILAPISALTGLFIGIFDKILITRLPGSFKENEKKRRF